MKHKTEMERKNVTLVKEEITPRGDGNINVSEFHHTVHGKLRKR